MTAPTEDLIARLENINAFPYVTRLTDQAAQALRALQAEVERLRGLVEEMEPMSICWATHYAAGRGFERHPTHADILTRARSALTGSAQG